MVRRIGRDSAHLADTHVVNGDTPALIDMMHQSATQDIHIDDSLKNLTQEDPRDDDDEDDEDDDEDQDGHDDDEGDDDENNQNNQQLHAPPSYSRIASVFRQKDVTKLAKYVSDIDSQLPTEFLRYREAVMRKEKLGDELISQVLEQNEQLKTRVIQLREKIEIAKIDSNEHLLLTEDNLSKNNQIKIEFIELLTGVKCLDAIDDGNYLKCKISQSGNVGKLNYCLIIDKSDLSVVYYPIGQIFVEVKQVLPNYLLDKFKFNVDEIRGFYKKIERVLEG